MLRDVPLADRDELKADVEKGAELRCGAEGVPLSQRERRRRDVLKQVDRRIVALGDGLCDPGEFLEVVGDPVGGLEEEEHLL